MKKKHRKTKRKTRKKKATGKKRIFIILFIALFLILCGALVFLFYEQGLPEKLSPTPSYTQKRPPMPAIEASKLYIPQFTTPKAAYIVKHTGYTVSYHPTHKIPNWVGYELTRECTKGTLKRTDRFIPNPLIKGHDVQSSDYTNSGYDRGHMVPAADMKWSEEAMKESFYLSNICPQHPELNRRRWKDLEEKVRKWAAADSAIIVICGPLISDRCRTIGKSKVGVPDRFFKVILSPYVSSPQAIGFLFKNERSTDPLHTYIVSVDSVETLTGMDFFSELPDSIENKIEAKVNRSYWGL